MIVRCLLDRVNGVLRTYYLCLFSCLSVTLPVRFFAYLSPSRWWGMARSSEIFSSWSGSKKLKTDCIWRPH